MASAAPYNTRGPKNNKDHYKTSEIQDTHEAARSNIRNEAARWSSKSTIFITYLEFGASRTLPRGSRTSVFTEFGDDFDGAGKSTPIQ